MSEGNFTCIKCGDKMVRGFAADKSELYFMKLAWIDGEPQNASLLGIKGDNVDIRGSERRIVRGLRCIQCGYLELYAV